MKIPRNCFIERAVSKDGTRQSLLRGCVEPAGHDKMGPQVAVIVALDGHILACVPVELEEGDVPGLVDADVLTDARKAGLKSTDTFRVGLGAEHYEYGGVRRNRPPVPDLTFPPWRQADPGYRAGDKGTFTLNFDANLLMRLVEAIGAYNTRSSKIRFTMDAVDMEAPIVVQAFGVNTGAFGLLMPVRP